MLYELLTDERPFSGERPNDILRAARHEEPVSMRTRRAEVPSALASIVSRCLTKDPADRYASAEALATELRSLKGRAEPEVPRSIAVVPFSPREATSAGPFTAGMHESLLSQLSSVSDLKVVVGTSGGREGDRTLSAVADELGVRWVATGSVWQADDRIQIHAQLVDGQTDANVWAETYRRDLTAENLFEVQEQITRRITEALKAEVTSGEQERIAETPTRNLDAYRLYAKGRAHLNRRDQEGLVHAVEYFRRAVEEDATYALAWAGLADAMNLFPLFGPEDHDHREIDAEQAARRALELSPDLAEGHTALGFLQGLPEGTRRLRHAVDLKPSYAQAHQWLGLKLLVAGNPDTAREHATIAAELAPRNRSAQGFLAFQQIAEGRYREGLAILTQETRSFEVEPDWGVEISSRFLFAALYSMGRWEKAQGLISQRRAAVETPEWIAEWNAKRGMVEVALGETERARKRVERLRETPGALYRGLLLMLLGDEDAACKAFEEVGTWGYYNVVELRYFYPEILDAFRQTPRYEALLEIVEDRRARNPIAAYEAASAPQGPPSG
jgi:TolB-like protein